MWLTGFDVKCLSCLYLDKPLKAHTLMQTIARANRVAEGKSNGLIVDYIGIVKALRKALADYTANVNGNGGADPTVDKEKLIARILDTISTAEAFLDSYGISLRDLVQARDFEKLALLQTAAKVSPADAGRHYGLKISRSGMVHCPFHNDTTPSMKLYDDHFYAGGTAAGD